MSTISLEGIEKIEIMEFETSSESPKFLVVFEDRHFEVSLFVADLIQILKKYPLLEDVVEIFRGPQNRIYDIEELENIVIKCIIPILESQKTQKPQPLLFKMELIPKEKIEVFSNILKFMFKAGIITFCMLMILVFEILFLIYSPELLRLGSLNIYIALGVVGLLVLSSFVHEIGHASACKYFNAEHGGVGFGFYLNFPVFYTDVSGVWKLPRKQRIVVNLAGVYFQMLMLIPIFIIYFLTYNNILKFFIIAVNFNLLITLNPFFKYDGYWIVSDLLGVANLRQRARELIAYSFNLLFRKPIKQKPYLLLMKKKEKRFMIIYSIIVNLFFAFYFFFIIPVFLYKFFHSFPLLMIELVTLLSSGATPGFDLLQAIFTQLIFFALIIFILMRMLVFPLFKQLKKVGKVS